MWLAERHQSDDLRMFTDKLQLAYRATPGWQIENKFMIFND